MISGWLGENPHPRMADADHYHMNCYCYLSSWINFASKLINNFSLSNEVMVSLIIEMYCDNNALNFVLVAKDLLLENDSIVKESLIDFGLSV
jgi:hypothetical protein